jgi:hypothetical protein
MGESSSPTSSPYDRASLLIVYTLFSIGTLFSLHRFFPLSSGRPQRPVYADFEQAPDDDADWTWIDPDGADADD